MYIKLLYKICVWVHVCTYLYIYTFVYVCVFFWLVVACCIKKPPGKKCNSQVWVAVRCLGKLTPIHWVLAALANGAQWWSASVSAQWCAWRNHWWSTKRSFRSAKWTSSSCLRQTLPPRHRGRSSSPLSPAAWPLQFPNPTQLLLFICRTLPNSQILPNSNLHPNLQGVGTGRREWGREWGRIQIGFVQP